MTNIAIVQYVVYFAVLVALAVPLGQYMARVYEGRAELASRVLGPIERGIYRIANIRHDDEMNWKVYTVCVLAFNLIGLLVVYAIERVQNLLPFNPSHAGPVAPDLALNTAVSFATNTNWQAYAGETAMSHLTQMTALTVQNYLSAATGMAVAVALARGFSRKNAGTLGNFWVDLTRGTLYILLPLSLVLAIVLVSQGVVQTFDGAVTVVSVQASKKSEADGKPVLEQVISVGPVASQVAIKQLSKTQRP
jgi:potassium-transporting ATPase potassium-binding subunit